MEAAAGQLKEACDPYRLVLPGECETLAEYYADELRARLVRDGTLGFREQGAAQADPNALAEAEPLYTSLGFVREPDPSMRLTL